MAKIVAVQDGLNEIAAKLKSIGYNVVNIDDMNHHLDAIVYSTAINSAQNVVHNNDLGSAYNDGYVLMLNAAEYSQTEIVNRINEL